jgi:hypothetical protein
MYAGTTVSGVKEKRSSLSIENVRCMISIMNNLREANAKSYV